MTKPAVAFVSGCFDLLHSGHVEFLQQAANFGQLLVAVGSDKTILQIKGRNPMCPQEERLFLVQSLKCVHTAFISSGRGQLDFEPELRRFQPDLFVANSDGDSVAKRELCRSLSIEYRLLERTPAHGLPVRSSTALRSHSQIPFRIDLAGGWLDQPFVSSVAPGPVIVVSIEPSSTYSGRSGLATSTRATAERLWGCRLPGGNGEALAKVLFACENPPGTTEISGSQDALGIVLPGVTRLDYDGNYWPSHTQSIFDQSILAWLGNRIFVKSLGERLTDFRVLDETNITSDSVRSLAAASNACWSSIRDQDINALGLAITGSFKAQAQMFPRMISPAVEDALQRLPRGVLGAKLAGAGGGGYLVVVAEACPSGFERIQVRFSENAL